MSELEKIPGVEPILNYVDLNQVATDLGFDPENLHSDKLLAAEAVRAVRIQAVADLALTSLQGRVGEIVAIRQSLSHQIEELDIILAELPTAARQPINSHNFFNRYNYLCTTVHSKEDFMEVIKIEPPFTIYLENIDYDDTKQLYSMKTKDLVRHHTDEIKRIAPDDQNLVRNITRAIGCRPFLYLLDHESEKQADLTNKGIIEIEDVDEVVTLLHVKKPLELFRDLFSYKEPRWQGLGIRGAISLLALAKFQEPYVIEALYRKDELDKEQP